MIAKTKTLRDLFAQGVGIRKVHFRATCAVKLPDKLPLRGVYSLVSAANVFVDKIAISSILPRKKFQNPRSGRIRSNENSKHEKNE